VIPVDFPQRLGEHLILVGVSVTLATALATGLALVSRHHASLRTAAHFICNTAQTIPSLALLAFLIPYLGIGTAPALTAITLYALLPILRGTLSGLQDIPPSLIDAARNLGSGSWDLLWRVEFPQSLPLIVAGIRTAAVWSVGTATLSAFIGAGGLGDYITRGLSLNNTSLLLAGAVPSALLALGLDAALGWCEKRALAWKNGS
jgi:osmoprotectant transport system permease protein